MRHVWICVHLAKLEAKRGTSVTQSMLARQEGLRTGVEYRHTFDAAVAGSTSCSRGAIQSRLTSVGGRVNQTGCLAGLASREIGPTEGVSTELLL